MKTSLLMLIIAAALTGCYSRRQIQVEMVSAQLVRIDTIYRYNGEDEKVKQQLTWRDTENIEYVSYVPLQTIYQLGTRMAVLRTR